MKLKVLACTAMIASGTLLSQAALADQLCQSNGDLPPSGCMNITWECGTFTVSDGQVCVSTIMAPNAEIKKDVGHSGGSYEIGDFEADIADMQKKEGAVSPIQSDDEVTDAEIQKAGKCPPVCKPIIIVEPDPLE